MRHAVCSFRKSALMAVGLVFSLVATTTVYMPQKTTAASCVYGTYRYGSRGTCVTYIQRMLNGAGNMYHYEGYERLGVDGVFGGRTRGQVYAFQWFEHIGYDGVVGPQTWRSLCFEARNHVGGDARTAGSAAGCPSVIGYW